jgi:hypothetical protein
MKMAPDTSRHDLLVGVERRRDEILEAVLARVRGIRASGQTVDAEGVRLAVETAIGHTIEAVKTGKLDPPVPEPILAQARLAARSGTALETVLRRYLAGQAVLSDFVVEEAERQRVAPGVLRWALRSQSAETDKVLAAIGSTYRLQVESAQPRTGAWRRAERVRCLLAGELLDPSGLDYELDRWHVGLVVSGDAGETIKALSMRVDASHLTVPGDDGLTWVWLGLKERPEPDMVPTALPLNSAKPFHTGIGEPGRGRAGWRLTHNQAKAAISVATRGDQMTVRYAEVALVASAIQDEVLTTSLRALYLDPLEERRDGQVLRDTLRAYLGTGGNVTSTAAVLGVSRNTVTNRIHSIETRIGHLRPPLAGDLALALRLDDLS